MDDITKIVASNLTGVIVSHLEKDGVVLRKSTDLSNLSGLKELIENIVFIYGLAVERVSASKFHNSSRVEEH